MAKLSKPFRIAVEGQTIDGRFIDPAWLRSIAKNYNKELYTAEIFPEHFRGMAPNSPFASQGSVEGVFTQEDIIAGEKRLALYATITPNESLLATNKRGEKKYASIEVRKDFPQSGEFYMPALAVTDTPASIGTEAMQFSAQLLHTYIGESQEVELEFYDDEPQVNATDGAFSKLKDMVVSMFKSQSTSSNVQLTEFTQVMQDMASGIGDKFSQLEKTIQELQDKDSEREQVLADLTEKYNRIDNTPATPERPAATGNDGYIVADY